ncbi:MAG TPA: GH3 auxin-responsive promoter family protein [Myxococcales bacterium]|nr:GH3 auxin-responsive promoter family protein [Myxococcales bacterium]
MLSTLLSFALTGTRRRFQAMKRDQPAAQAGALRHLVRVGRGTRFGREHGLDGVRDYGDFRRRVPLRRYEHFQPYLDLIRAGGPDVLAAGRPRYWGRTGGTTGKDKLLPIYPSAIAQSRRTFNLALALHLARHPELGLWGKKLLFLGSCAPLGMEAGLPSGFMSSIMVNEFSPLVRRMVLPGKRVDHLPGWSEKVAAILRMTRGEDVVIAAGMPPWLCAFFRYAQEQTGRPVREIWPNLSLVLHSGVSVDGYRAALEQLLGGGVPGPLPSLRNAFGATEGNFAIQERDEDRDLLLVADDVFYELVPLDDYLAGRGQEARRPIWEARVGEEYALVLTTPGGLWGYVIGDTVRFTSVHPYRFVISGRTAQFLNTAGEKVSVEQAVSAVASACARVGAAVEEHTLFPLGASPAAGRHLPGHEWVVEFSRRPPSLRAFLEAVDQAMCDQNPLYRVRRSSRFGDTALLSPPVLRALRPGTYAAWQSARGRLGGHFKVPRISSDETLRQELVKGTSDEPEVLGSPA